MRYSDTLTFFDSLTNYEHIPLRLPNRDLNLTRVQYALAALGHPERAFRTLLVAGTNGKGSTAVMAQAILTAAGYRVGLYTSPHLSSPRERICVGNQMIPKQSFAACTARLQKQLPLPAEVGRLTYFEAMTLVAALYFASQQVSYAVCEVGLGGRLDATRTFGAQGAVITPVSLDHQAVLGNTLSQIAREKVHVIPQGGFVVSARQPRLVERIIQRAAQQKEASHYSFGRDFHADRLQRITLPLLGQFQIENAACAIQSARLLLGGEAMLTRTAIRQGLAQIHWPGRMEYVNHRQEVILDGAHNPAAMTTAARTLTALFPTRTIMLVFGVSQDKDWRSMLRVLSTLKPQEIVLTQSRHPRALPVAQLAPLAKRLFRTVTTHADICQALRHAKQQESANSVTVVTGSFFVVAEARKALGCPTYD